MDFFHDVVCSWCYVMSPRLRQAAAELGIQVRQRSFVLQDNREQMVQVFGSMARAKSVILGHWETCLGHEDQPRIDVEGMRAEISNTPAAWPARWPARPPIWSRAMPATGTCSTRSRMRT